MVVATVQDGMIKTSDTALVPLYLKKTGDVEGWLAGRAIDSHRTNSRLLKKALRLSGIDDAQLVLKVNAVTITDTYWFRPAGSELTYQDVRFKANMFDKLALNGDPDSFNQPWSPTPELTNIGSFEKCWRLVDGTWWMTKQGSELERFSELFLCNLGKALGFPMAEYIRENGTIKSPDFTKGASVNFEAAEGLVGEDEDYRRNFQVFSGLSTDMAREYLQIIHMDTLGFNMDRHTKNYGVLRDVETGGIISMAPNFDNNIALFSRGIPKNITRENDKLVQLYLELLEQEPMALEICRTLPLPTADMIEQSAKRTGLPYDTDTVCTFVLSAANKIRKWMKIM